MTNRFITSKQFKIFGLLILVIAIFWIGKLTLSSILTKDAVNYAYSHNNFEAIKKIDRAIWFNKNDKHLYFLKSHILSSNGKQKESILVLKDFISMSNDIEGINLAIGFNYDELNEEDSAHYYYLKELNYCQHKIERTYVDNQRLIDLNFMIYGKSNAKNVADSLDKLNKCKSYKKYLEFIEGINYDTTHSTKHSRQLQNCPDYHFNKN